MKMDIKQKVEFIMMQLSEVLEELNENDVGNLSTRELTNKFSLPVVNNTGLPAPQLTPAVSTLQVHKEQIKQQQIQNNQVVKETARITQGKWQGENVDIYEFPSTTV